MISKIPFLKAHQEKSLANRKRAKKSKDVLKGGSASTSFNEATHNEVLGSDEGEGLFVNEVRRAESMQASVKVQATSKKDSLVKRQQLARLVGELEGYGEKLINAGSIQSFIDYRRVLQKIMKSALPEAYALKAKHYPIGGGGHVGGENIARDGEKKEYRFVEKISEEIDSLLAMVRHNADDKLQLAAKVISIKGLVVDYLG